MFSIQSSIYHFSLRVDKLKWMFFGIQKTMLKFRFSSEIIGKNKFEIKTLGNELNLT
jgi:hypothetical protein